MSQVLTLENPPSLSKLQHPFLEELIEQIRRADTLSKYRNWSNELLLDRLISSSHQESVSAKNNQIDSLNNLLTLAFYQAIRVTIERITGHHTEIFTHLEHKECSSAVICCGGVLVLYSLIWGYQRLSFSSLQHLIESAESNIHHAVTKASRYLDF